MSRVLISVVLGAAILLVAAACGSQTASETNPEKIDSSQIDSAPAGDSAVQNAEAGSKPVVTVNLSPT